MKKAWWRYEKKVLCLGSTVRSMECLYCATSIGLDDFSKNRFYKVPTCEEVLHYLKFKNM